jgi:hypothetical protein
MKHTLKWIAAGAAAAALTCGAPFSLASPVTPESTAWQHHSAKFNYSGFTSAYTCEGMEGKVRQIMQFLGARKDMTINASGCPRGPNSPSHMVWVTLEFDTLAPAAAGAASAAMVPFFMDAGDCELIEAMKPMLTANFSLRALDYSTSCTPHEVTFADFRIKGEVLKADPEHAG